MPRLTNWAERPEVAAYVMTNYAQLGPSDLSEQIQSHWGLTVLPDTVRKYYARRRLREGILEDGLDVSDPPVVESIGGELRPDQRNPAGPEDVEELFRRAMEECERKETQSLAQSRLTINRSGERLPVGVCFWSDWQVGMSGVMLRQLKADAEALVAAEGLATFVLGDLIQNFNLAKHPYGLHECVLPDPNEQIACARWILQKVGRERIEGMVDGNHERNSKKAAGLMLTEAWARELQVPYLWHGAHVTYKVGAQTYTMGLRHKFRGESGLNTTSAQRTMYEQWHPADIEVLGHLHFNDMQKRRKPGRETVWLRAGSYLKWDDHGQDIGGYKGSWGIPLVVLYPDTHKVIPFYGADFYTGLEFLADQRRRYAEKQA
jgi:hypothetical protein